MKITRQDTNGVKPLLQVGELGYDNYHAGGDKGRVFVGTGTENIGLAKRAEVVAVDTKADTHIARVDNPHAVTKAQVGLGNVDNTADVDKNVLSATKLTNARTINGVTFDGTSDITIATGTATTVVNGVYTIGDQTIDGVKTFSSTIAGSISGNSASATKLATARTIGGVSFDGTANINLPGVNAAGNQSTTGNAATATTLQTARTINGVSFNGSANITVSDDTKLPKTNPVIVGSITEQVYNLTGTVISPANGTIQYKTVSANTAFTETLTSGQSVLLRLLNASNYTIAFPTITWVGATAPTLTANCVIVLWKEQTTLYGAFVGSLV